MFGVVWRFAKLRLQLRDPPLGRGEPFKQRVLLGVAQSDEVDPAAPHEVLCMRLGNGQAGTTLESLHTVRRVAPISGEHLVVRRETGKE